MQNILGLDIGVKRPYIGIVMTRYKIYINIACLLIIISLSACISKQEQSTLDENAKNCVSKIDGAIFIKCDEPIDYSDVGPGQKCFYIKDNKIKSYMCLLKACYDIE